MLSKWSLDTKNPEDNPFGIWRYEQRPEEDTFWLSKHITAHLREAYQKSRGESYNMQQYPCKASSEENEQGSWGEKGSTKIPYQSARKITTTSYYLMVKRLSNRSHDDGYPDSWNNERKILLSVIFWWAFCRLSTSLSSESTVRPSWDSVCPYQLIYLLTRDSRLLLEYFCVHLSHTAPYRLQYFDVL